MKITSLFNWFITLFIQACVNPKTEVFFEFGKPTRVFIFKVRQVDLITCITILSSDLHELVSCEISKIPI